MTEKIKNNQEIDSISLLPRIFNNVKAHGDLADMSSWQLAFPQVEFISEEEQAGIGNSDEVCPWDERTAEEKAIYVLLTEYPNQLKMTLGFSNVRGDEADWIYPGLNCLLGEPGDYQQVVTDDEMLLWHWICGAFKATNLLTPNHFDQYNLSDFSKRALWAEYLHQMTINHGELHDRLFAWRDHLIDMNLDYLNLDTFQLSIT